MRVFLGSRIGVDQGNVEVFSDFSDGGAMWTGSGLRERRAAVTFARPFRTEPAVHVGLSLWDMDHNANLRADLEADAVTQTGFDLVFRTWADSRVARVRMAWMAIGEMPHEDDWDLY